MSFHRFPRMYRPSSRYTHLRGTVLSIAQSGGETVVTSGVKRLDDTVVPLLPPVETFSLENHLKSGVPLEKVNSMVLSPSDPAISQYMEKQAEHVIESIPEPTKND